LAKAPRRRLKVFQAQFGFYDSVVAAPSQPAALSAWGTRQNLFAEGQARLCEDDAAVAAALAHPGEPLRRAVGSKRPFSLEPGLPDVPAAPQRKGPGRAHDAEAAKPARVKPPKPAPDRDALDAAEARLKAVNDRRVAEEADLEQRRAALDAQDAQSRKVWSKARAEAERAVDKARAAYRKAGG
jgi:hypothetical protein